MGEARREALRIDFDSQRKMNGHAGKVSSGRWDVSSGKSMKRAKSQNPRHQTPLLTLGPEPWPQPINSPDPPPIPEIATLPRPKGPKEAHL